MASKTLEYKHLVDKNPAGAAICRIKDGKLNLVYHNDGFFKLMGIPYSERLKVQNENIVRACHPEDIKIVENEVMKIVCGQEIIDCNFRILKVPGLYTRIRLLAKVIERNDNANEIVIYVSFFNIEQQEKLQNELIDKNKEIEAIVNQAGFNIYRYDISTGNSYHYSNTLNSISAGSVVTDLVNYIISNGYIAPESRDDFIEFFEKIKRGQQGVTGHFRMLIYDSGFCWIKQDATIVYKNDGSPDYAIISYCRADDFYEKKTQYEKVLSEQSLTDSQVLFSFHINLSKNNTNNYIAMPGEKFDIDFNASLDSVFSAMLLRIPYSAHRRNFCSTFSKNLLYKKFTEGIVDNELEHPYASASFGTIWIKTRVKMARNPDTGEIEGTLYGVDINDKHRLKLLIDKVVDTSYDYITVINKITREYTTYVSRAEDYLPFKSRGLYNMDVAIPILKFIHPADVDRLTKAASLNAILEALEKENRFDISYRIIINEERKAKRLTFVYLDENHQDIVLFRSDITDIVAKDEQQRADMADALVVAKKANAAKSDFLSRMSHDIRTPMNTIIGMTELAMTDMDNKEQINESFRVIKDSSEHLLNLINDILDMSRIESGKMVLSDEITNLKEMYTTSVESIALLAEKKNITFTSNFNVIHNSCECDVQRISRVINNLGGNAVKFTPEGGKIETTFTEVPFGKHGFSLFEFVIKDSGVGMNEETVSHIYDPFYRANNVISENTVGTGLGLPIVKSILDLIGGTIDVESKMGKGSKFTVQFPLRISDIDVPDVANELPQPKPLGSLFGLKILLVEDNLINQKISKRLLEKLGATVSTADNGKEAYEAFKQSDPLSYDVILMDIQMPVMDGYEATHAIRHCRHHDAKAIPIVALSANAFAVDVHKSLEAGMNAHISKPVDLMKLFTALSPYVK